VIAGKIAAGDEADGRTDLPALAKMAGFSSVRMKAREMSGPTPLTGRSNLVSG
jgi:hypothetical protein